jgi:SAM-dependent methyltransferase
MIETIISLNVLEHVEDDRAVLRNFFNLLAPRGHVILIVPCHPSLYTECDKALGHFRRYSDKEIKDKLEEAGFKLLSLKQINRLGVLGWYMNGKLGRRHLSPLQIRFYEWLLPIAKLIDNIGLGPGLSLIVVGKKPSSGKLGIDLV